MVGQSQDVEQLYARELLADGNGSVGYLLKDRVFNTEQFVEAVRSVAAGGTAMDPQLVAKLRDRATTHAVHQRRHQTHRRDLRQARPARVRRRNRRVLAVLAYLNR
ncbi:response regulator transcription factor [Kribbella pratensis]|uniref:response regulator transcription factor n=1 Tax=Kribbella pratensis TaxID=2512112 RepID=UPI001416F3EB|nr:response regulator transcription factor [Kribbella pratensis]